MGGGTDSSRKTLDNEFNLNSSWKFHNEMDPKCDQTDRTSVSSEGGEAKGMTVGNLKETREKETMGSRDETLLTDKRKNINFNVKKQVVEVLCRQALNHEVQIPAVESDARVLKPRDPSCHSNQRASSSVIER